MTLLSRKIPLKALRKSHLPTRAVIPDTVSKMKPGGLGIVNQIAILACPAPETP